MKKRHLLAIDQGTSSSRTVIYDDSAEVVSSSQKEFVQIYPKPGWVEHDPEAIWTTSLRTAQRAFADGEAKGKRVVAIGITNQRETTLVWDKNTGKPYHNAIVWQCRRTTEMCNELHDKEQLFRQRTGLPLDAYFSGTKIKWILDNACD